MSVFAESILYDSRDMLYRGDTISNWGSENECLQEISVCLSHQSYRFSEVITKNSDFIDCPCISETLLDTRHAWDRLFQSNEYSKGAS